MARLGRDPAGARIGDGWPLPPFPGYARIPVNMGKPQTEIVPGLAVGDGAGFDQAEALIFSWGPFENIFPSDVPSNEI